MDKVCKSCRSDWDPRWAACQRCAGGEQVKKSDAFQRKDVRRER